MKRSLTLLLASLLVVFGLTACGGNNNKQDQNQNDDAVVDGDTAENNGTNANDGLTNNGNSSNGNNGNGTATDGTHSDDSLMDDVEQGINDTVQGAEDALDDVTGKARTSNAYVHDRDGDLTDMENGVARNSIL